MQHPFEELLSVSIEQLELELKGFQTEAPHFEAELFHEENGHLVPYAKLKGGTLRLSEEGVFILRKSSTADRA